GGRRTGGDDHVAAGALTRLRVAREAGLAGRRLPVEEAAEAANAVVVATDHVDQPAERGVHVNRSGVEHRLDVSPVPRAVEERFEHREIGRAEDRYRAPVEGNLAHMHSRVA